MIFGGLEFVVLAALKTILLGTAAAGIVVLTVITVAAIFEAIGDWYGDSVSVVKPHVLYDHISDSRTRNEIRNAVNSLNGSEKRIAINQTTGEIRPIVGNSIDREVRNADVIDITW
jgi:hypothetical protein